MRVLTLDDEGFAQACSRLEHLCRASRPQAVVGIATGGEHAARLMFSHLPHYTVTARRPGSGTRGRLKGLLRRLPRPVNNSLRKLESRLLRMRNSGPRQVLGVDPEAMQKYDRILLVDDAVDSGATLRAVLEALSPLVQTVTTAAITVTTPRPAVRPDIALYDNGTLIRFPWSNDA